MLDLLAQPFIENSTEPQWLSSLRKTAFEVLQKQGVPSKKNEAFKYTALDRLLKQEYLTVPMTQKSALSLDSPFFQVETKIVLVDGVFREDLSHLPQIAGVRCYSFLQAIKELPEEMTLVLTENGEAQAAFFSLLNTIKLQDGIVIQIAEGVDAGNVLVVSYTTEQEKPLMTHSRVCILAKKNSRATVVEHFLGDSKAQNLMNCVTNIHLDENAQLEHINIQAEPALTDHIGQLQVKQKKNSEFKTYLLSYGALLSRHAVQVQLLEKEAKTHLYGLFIPTGTQHMDQYTVVEHVADHASSHEFYRGILSEKGRGVFNAKVIVHPDAQKTVTRQVNNNLLLSSTAEIDTKPELQIYADDVQCSHGATIGQLDENALFYMQARGLNAEAARALLLNAFAAAVFQSISHQELRHYLETAWVLHLGAVHGL